MSEGWMQLRDTWHTFSEGDLMLSACGRDGRDEDDAGWSVANNYRFPYVVAHGETKELALEAYAAKCREKANRLLWMADAAGRAIEQIDD
jgi:hypothetical protein